MSRPLQREDQCTFDHLFANFLSVRSKVRLESVKEGDQLLVLQDDYARRLCAAPAPAESNVLEKIDVLASYLSSGRTDPTHAMLGGIKADVVRFAAGKGAMTADGTHSDHNRLVDIIDGLGEALALLNAARLIAQHEVMGVDTDVEDELQTVGGLALRRLEQVSSQLNALLIR